MESNRILGVAVESPVHWVRVTIPPGAADPRRVAEPAAPPSCPAEGSPLLLHLARALLPDGSSLAEFVAVADPELEPWCDATLWGAGASATVERHAALVSLVGEGVLSQGELMRRASEALRRSQVSVWGLFTGTLSISFLVPEAAAEEAARILHHDLIEGTPSPK